MTELGTEAMSPYLLDRNFLMFTCLICYPYMCMLKSQQCVCGRVEVRSRKDVEFQFFFLSCTHVLKAWGCAVQLSGNEFIVPTLNVYMLKTISINILLVCNSLCSKLSQQFCRIPNHQEQILPMYKLYILCMYADGHPNIWRQRGEGRTMCTALLFHMLSSSVSVVLLCFRKKVKVKIPPVTE